MKQHGEVYVGNNGSNNWRLEIEHRAAIKKSKGPAWELYRPEPAVRYRMRNREAGY